MGWRYRKSKKILPGVRINFNKNSTSITFGEKGLHYTVSSTGKKTTTVGIPGTGLSYSTSAGNKKSAQQPKELSLSTPTEPNLQTVTKEHHTKPKPNGCLAFILGIAVIFIALTIITSVMRFIQAQNSAEIPPPPSASAKVEVEHSGYSEVD